MMVSDGDGGFSCLAVADDEFRAWPRPIGIMLSMALSPVAMGSRTGLAVDDAGSDALERIELCGGDGAFAVDGPGRASLTTRPIMASPTGTLMMRPVRLTSSPSLISVYSAEEDDADLIFFEVHGDAGEAVREGEQFAGHDLIEAVNAGDAVAEGDDGADFVDLRFWIRNLRFGRESVW